MTLPPLYYLAHPVRGDKLHSLADNLGEAHEYYKQARRAGLLVLAPYLLDCECLDDTVEAERAAGIALDMRLLPLCDALILTGHKVSEGMQHELTAMEGKAVFNFVGMRHSEVATQFKHLALIDAVPKWRG